MVITRIVVSVIVATYFGASVVTAFSGSCVEARAGVVRRTVSTCGYAVVTRVLWRVKVVVGVPGSVSELQGRVT